MVDTQRFQLGPQCVRVVQEVTHAVGASEDLTNALEITSYLPLDVESVARILDSLEEEKVVERLQGEDGLVYFRLHDDDAGHLSVDQAQRGEHLEHQPGFMRNLNALRQDPEWLRKVREQHEIIGIAAGAKHRTIDLAYFTSRTDVPSARIQSMLNDFAAEGYVHVEFDEDEAALQYTFPHVSYPRDRRDRNFEVLAALESRPSRVQRYWLVIALAAALLLAFVILARLSVL